MMQIGMYHRDRHDRQTPPLDVRRARNRAARRLHEARTPAERRRAHRALMRTWRDWERFYEQANRSHAEVVQPERMAVSVGGVTQVGFLVALAITGAVVLVTLAAAVWR